MNGAMMLPPPRISSSPIKRRISNMGISHHFFLVFKNFHKSLKNLIAS